MLTSNTNSQAEAPLAGIFNITPAAQREAVAHPLSDKQTKFAKLFASLLPENSNRAGFASQDSATPGLSKQELADTLNGLAKAFNQFLENHNASDSDSETGLPKGILLAQNAISDLEALPGSQSLDEVLSDLGVSSVKDYIQQSLTPHAQANFAAITAKAAGESVGNSVAKGLNMPIEETSDAALKVVSLIQNALSKENKAAVSNPVISGENAKSQSPLVNVGDLMGNGVLDSTDSSYGQSKQLTILDQSDATKQDLLKAMPMAPHTEEQADSVLLDENKQAQQNLEKLGLYIRDIAKQHGEQADKSSVEKISISDAVHAFQAQYGRGPAKNIEDSGQTSQTIQNASQSNEASDMDLIDADGLATIASLESVDTTELDDKGFVSAGLVGAGDLEKTNADQSDINAGVLSNINPNNNDFSASTAAVNTNSDAAAATASVDADSREISEMAQSLHQVHGVAGKQNPNTAQLMSQQNMGTASSNNTHQSSQTNQTVTTWGNVSADGSANASANSSSNGQSQQQSQQQNQSMPQQAQAQQQLMQLQENLRNKTTALQQQMAVKASDEAARSENRELVSGFGGSSFDRSTQLPTGMQSINVPIRNPQWGQALGQRVVFMANNQIQQARITLNPENLGPVQVKLHMDKDQQMHVTMHAQHLTTREAMEAALPRLREMLEQSGVTVASVSVDDQSQFAENSAGFDSSDNNEGQNGTAAGQDMIAEADEDPAQITSTDNLVDYYA